MTQDQFYEVALPIDSRAEHALVTAALFSQQCLSEARRLCDDSMFMNPLYSYLFTLAGHIADTGGPKPDILGTLEREARKRGKFENFAQDQWWETFHRNAGHRSRIAEYAADVRAAWQRRQIVAAAHAAREAAYDMESPADEAVTNAIETLAKSIGRDDGEGEQIHFADFLGMVDSPEKSVLPTQIAQIDRTIGGFTDGQLVIVGARPSVGKTSLATSIALYWIHAGVRFAFVTLEMPERDVNMRIACADSDVAFTDWRFRRMSPQGEKMLRESVKVLTNKRVMHVMDASSPTITRVAAELVYAVERYGIRAAFVDYLQLVRSSGKGGMRNREQEVAEVSRGLKAVAKRTGIPVIAMCQLNREGEDAPTLRNLRESGSIEQDADVVMLLHRDPSELGREAQNIQIIIAKNRNGPTGSASVTFLTKSMLFVSDAPAKPIYCPPDPVNTGGLF